MYTIALLPSKKVEKQLVSLSKAHKEDFVSGVFNSRYNKPHVTLLKTSFKADTNLNELLESVVSESNFKPSASLQGLSMKGNREILAHLSHDESIVNMHNVLLPHVKPLVNKSGIKNKKFVGGTVEEVESYFKYGYRYTGDKFFSHLTFGRAKEFYIPYEFEKEYEDLFLGREIVFDRIVVCRHVKNMLGHVVASKKFKAKEFLLIS